MSDQNIIGYKWIFKMKKKANDTVDCYKPHLVTKCFNQQVYIDYDNIFSHVIKLVIIRIALSLAIV